MSEEAVATKVSAPEVASAEQSIDSPADAKDESKIDVAQNGVNGTEASNDEAAKADDSMNEVDTHSAKENSVPPPTQDTEGTENKDTSTPDTTMKKEDDKAASSADAGADSADGAADPASKAKSRRKSGVPEHRGKKLNRKGSSLKQLHLDAKPGDYFMFKQKGYPAWPSIIADEDMLPQELLATRPQTAARGDGTYREEYADGGKRVKERTYPIMFMATNQFAWAPNTDLKPIDLEASANIPKIRTKWLNEAHTLAVEQHPLSYWKEHLNNFYEAKRQAQDEADARKLAKEEKEKDKKKTTSKSKVIGEGDVADDDDGDTTMDLAEPKKKKAASKKRVLGEGETNAGTPAAKKIKLNLSKSVNGTPASSAKPKSEKKESTAKPKKSAKQKEAAAEPPKPVEPELTPEELKAKKEREILFLRHKLQKGLLNRDAPPEESQMAQMAEYINKLEGYPDLEVSIIKVTKINKVLKAILKLDSIPKEAEFNFKSRSTSLLAKWNHILDNAPKDTPAPAATNGLTNGDAKSVNSDAAVKEEESNGTNGVKKDTEDNDVDMKDASANSDNATEDAEKVKADGEAKDTEVPDATPAVEATS